MHTAQIKKARFPRRFSLAVSRVSPRLRLTRLTHVIIYGVINTDCHQDR